MSVKIDGQNRYVRISILDSDFCIRIKQNENDEVYKYKKCDKFYPNKHDVSPVYGSIKCQEKCICLIAWVMIHCYLAIRVTRFH